MNTNMEFISVVANRKVGTRQYRVAKYYNEHFSAFEYRVEKYTKNGGFCPVGNLRSDFPQHATKLMNNL